MTPYAFTAGRWVSDDHFLGRRALLENVLSCLAQPDRFATRRFVGRRRQGKTSLLYAISALVEHLQAPAARRQRFASVFSGAAADDASLISLLRDLSYVHPADAPRLVPVYIDQRAKLDVRGLSGQIARAAERPLGKTGFTAQILRSEDPLGGLLEGLVDLSLQQPFGLVLLVDEAESLAPSQERLAEEPALQQSAADVIRAWQALTEQNDVPLQVYLASTRTLDLRAAGRLRALIDAIPVFPIGNLDEPAVAAMLSRSGLSDAHRQELADRCGRNPYLLHVLGFSFQNPLSKSDPQIDLGLSSDFKHVTDEERAWLQSLAHGRPKAPPATVQLLEWLDYVRPEPSEAGAGYRIQEPLLEEWLRRQDPAPSAASPAAEPAVLSAPAYNQASGPMAPSAEPAGPCTLSLRRYADANVQSFGVLEISGVEPVNLGAQSYALLHVLAEAARRGGDGPPFRDTELKYMLYIVLGLAGCSHRGLNPKGVYSTLRNTVRGNPRRPGVALPGNPPPLEWLPGRGGYRFHEAVAVLQADTPLTRHAVDPLAVYRRWFNDRDAFLRFLRESVVRRSAGSSLHLALRPSTLGLFPEYAWALFIEIRDAISTAESSGAVKLSLGPIPFTDEQAASFRYWQAQHMDDGLVNQRDYVRWLAETGARVDEGAQVTDLCRPLEEFELRGESFLVGGQPHSSEWLPSPATLHAVSTAPDWLDLHFEESTEPLTADEVQRRFG